jgi:hypothetical protein
MQIKITVRFKEKALRHIEVDTIDIKYKDREIPNGYDTLDQINLLIKGHNWYNSEEIHNELAPHILKLKNIVNAYDNVKKDIALSEMESYIDGLKCCDSVEFTSNTDHFSEKSEYTAKLYQIILPKYIYIITTEDDDDFGCCHSKPPTYTHEIPTIVTTQNPKFSGYDHKNKCYIYKLEYDEYVLENTKYI